MGWAIEFKICRSSLDEYIKKYSFEKVLVFTFLHLKKCDYSHLFVLKNVNASVICPENQNNGKEAHTEVGRLVSCGR